MLAFLAGTWLVTLSSLSYVVCQDIQDNTDKEITTPAEDDVASFLKTVEFRVSYVLCGMYYTRQCCVGNTWRSSRILGWGL